MLNANDLRGTYPALVTPFSCGGETVDFDSLAALVDYVLAARVNGVVVCGSTGEAASLSDDEYRSVVRFVRECVAGRAPCVAGIGTSSTKRACETAEFLKSAGLDGALLVGPPYIKPPQSGVIEHFKAVQRASGLALIAYNIPGRAVVNILPETILQMAAQGLILGVKEASGSMDQAMDIAAGMSEDFALLSGEDSLVHAVMSLGGRGTITAAANVIPELMVEITDNALRGQWKSSLAAQKKALPVIRALFRETNPIPLKCALCIKGVISSAAVRVPLMPASAGTENLLRSLLAG